jgi:hypothetical protein
MNKFKITFFGREQGAIGQFATMDIVVQTPYSFINDDIAIRAVNSAGYECNHIKDIEKLEYKTI